MTYLHEDQVERLSNDQLYWASLESSLLGGRNAKSARARRRLGFAFERFLPCPIEEVHAVYLRTGETVLACGIDWDRLNPLLEQGCLRIEPGAVPDWLDAETPAASFNLARCEATPSAIKTAMSRLAALASIAASLMLGVVAIGLHGRSDTLAAASSNLRAASDQAIIGQLGPSLSGQLPKLRLTAELRRLMALDSSSASYAGADSAVPTLAAALEAWPPGIIAQTESLTATSTTLRVRTLHESTAAADQFASAWKPDPAIWTAQQPGMTTQRGEVRLDLVCVRTANGGSQ